MSKDKTVDTDTLDKILDTFTEKKIGLEALEAQLLRRAYQRNKGNQSATARALGLSRYALRYRLEKLKLDETTAATETSEA